MVMKKLPNSFSEFILPDISEWSKSCWHLFVVRTKDRDKMKAIFTNHGITTLIHYPIPPHKQNAYKHLGCKTDEFPMAEKLATEVISLPMEIHLNEEILEKSVFSTGL